MPSINSEHHIASVRKAPAQLVAELERKVQGHPNPKNRTLGKRLFFRATPARFKAEGVKVHDLDGLHRAIAKKRDADG